VRPVTAAASCNGVRAVAVPSGRGPTTDDRTYRSPTLGRARQGRGALRWMAHDPLDPKEHLMRLTSLLHALRPVRGARVADAHCDLMCGVYYPEQARIEAESVLMSAKKYHDSDDEVFRQRAITIKEERAELVKHHLSVLWTDYFKPPHLEEYPELHEMFWHAIKAAGEAKKTMDVAVAEDLIAKIDAISEIFYKTKGGKPEWLTS